MAMVLLSLLALSSAVAFIPPIPLPHQSEGILPRQHQLCLRTAETRKVVAAKMAWDGWNDISDEVKRVSGVLAVATAVYKGGDFIREDKRVSVIESELKNTATSTELLEVKYELAAEVKEVAAKQDMFAVELKEVAATQDVFAAKQDMFAAELKEVAATQDMFAAKQDMFAAELKEVAATQDMFAAELKEVAAKQDMFAATQDMFAAELKEVAAKQDMFAAKQDMFAAELKEDLLSAIRERVEPQEKRVQSLSAKMNVLLLVASIVTFCSGAGLDFNCTSSGGGSLSALALWR